MGSAQLVSGKDQTNQGNIDEPARGASMTAAALLLALLACGDPYTPPPAPDIVVLG